MPPGYKHSWDDFRLGLAVGYSKGDLKMDKLGYKNEADVLNLALYRAWRQDSGFYVEGGSGYGRAWNDYKVRDIAIAGSLKKGEYDSKRFGTDLELGYVAALGGGDSLIPSLGLEYSYLSHDGWIEKASANLLANRFRSGHDSGLDIPVSLCLNKVAELHGGRLVPKMRAAYVYAADKTRPSVTGCFAGTPAATVWRGWTPAAATGGWGPD